MRTVVERAFALLKGRFRRLKYLDMSLLALIPDVILACCVLHNICLQEYDDDNILDFIEEGDIQLEEADIQFEENNEINIAMNNPIGIAKRNYLCNVIA